jgi:hypothetical protein
MSVGYATLYGDMNGLQSHQDVYKTEVYGIAGISQQPAAEELPGPGRIVFRGAFSKRRQARSFSPTRKIRTACRPTPCSTTSSSSWSSMKHPWRNHAPRL